MKHTVQTIFLLTMFTIARAQTDSLFGMVNNQLIKVNKTTAEVGSVAPISGSGVGFLPFRFSFSKKSGVFYGLERKSDGDHLYSLSLSGNLREIGLLQKRTGILYFAESIAINRSTQKVYISGSTNGSTATGDYYSESILEVDTTTAQCETVHTLNTNAPLEDADLMCFDDDGNLYFMDGNPGSWNKLYKTSLNNTTTISPFYIGQYVAAGDMTFLDNKLYYTVQKELVVFDLATNTIESQITMYANTAFNGENIKALSWVDACTNEVKKDSLTQCQGSNILLSSTINSPVIWSTGARHKQIVVEGSGWYVATASNECSDIDSFWVETTMNPLNLTPERILCEDSFVWLDASTSNLENYSWSTSATDSEIRVEKAGVYYLSTTLGGCTFTDSTLVLALPKLFVVVPSDTTLCVGMPYTLTAKTNAKEIAWNTSEIGTTILVWDSGRYIATVSNECFASVDSVTVLRESCDCFFEIPSAFSPTRDGLNDNFRPVVDCPILDFEMMIFTRWGEIIYKTPSYLEGWDGIYQGQICQNGIYYYSINLKTPFSQKKYTGRVHLIR